MNSPLRLKVACAAAVLAALVASPALFAQDKPEAKHEGEAKASAPFITPDSVTEGSITVEGQPVAYKAVAGTLTVGGNDVQDATIGLDGKYLPDAGVDLPSKPEDQPPTARIFYAAYFKKGAPSSSRPITFLYNGGPGSATMYLHMGAFGPKRIAIPDVEHPAAAPYPLIENQYSLLDVSDLVFIDAPGTGFSRVFGKDAGKAFWGIDEDARAFDRFIRRFLTKYDRWNSPNTSSARATAPRAALRSPASSRGWIWTASSCFRRFSASTTAPTDRVETLEPISPTTWRFRRWPRPPGTTIASRIRLPSWNHFCAKWSSSPSVNMRPHFCKART